MLYEIFSFDLIVDIFTDNSIYIWIGVFVLRKGRGFTQYFYIIRIENVQPEMGRRSNILGGVAPYLKKNTTLDSASTNHDRAALLFKKTQQTILNYIQECLKLHCAAPRLLPLR